MATEKPRRLGRGLEALLSNASSAPTSAEQDRRTLVQVPLSQLRPNPFQPRRDFPVEEIAELKASLASAGLLQPITVRRAPSGNGYELIAGERRTRAATELGWTEISAVVKEVDDRTLLTLALIENLQRADLNPIEEAGGYQRLMEEFSLTQQQVADAVGKDRVTVANLLRLLNLPTSVRRMLELGSIQPGHARPLLALQDESRIVELAREVAERGMSVREVERLVMSKVPDKRRGSGRKGAREGEKGGTTPTRTGAETAARRLEDEIRRFMQTDVRVTLSGPDRGTIQLSFYSAEDLERILDLMLGVNREAL